jgi:hypothetical protein
MGFGSSYNIEQGTLATMKEAAGNFMPEYGNWRFRGKPAEPTPPKKGEETKKTSDGTKIKRTGGAAPPPQEVIDTDTDETQEVEAPNENVEIYTYDRLEQDLLKRGYSADDAYRIAQVEAPAWNLKNKGTTNPTKEGVTENYLLTPEQAAAGELGGVSSTYDPETDTWQHPNQNALDTQVSQLMTGGDYQYTDVGPDTSLGAIGLAGGTRQLRTDDPAMKKLGSAFNHGTAFHMNHMVDPYADVDRMMEDAASKVETSGSIATKEMHEHVKNIARDLKNNVFKPNTDDKQGKQEALVTLAQISKSFKDDVGQDGAINNLYTIYKDNLLSDSTTKQEKYIMAQLFQMNNVTPMVDDENNVVYPIQLPTGETIPVTNQYINELTIKRVKPYAIAEEYNNAKGDFYNSGRENQPWNKDDVIMNSMRIVDADPNKFAALLLDRGIFTPDPLINKILDAKAPGMSKQINVQEFVLNALGDSATRLELQKDFAEMLHTQAKVKWDQGQADYQKEMGKSKEGGQLSAQELIAKYSK